MIIKRRLQRQRRRQHQRCSDHSTILLTVSDHPFSAQGPVLLYSAAWQTLKHKGTAAYAKVEPARFSFLRPRPQAVLLFDRKGQGKPAHFQLTTSCHQGITASRHQEIKTIFVLAESEEYSLISVLHNEDHHCMCFLYCKTFTTLSLGHVL